MRAELDADVVVVGAGAAGLMAASSAARHCETVVLTDRAPGACNSAMAQGGLQLPRADVDARRRFADDVVRSARVDVDRDLVRAFVDRVEGCVADLERWGLALDRDQHNELIRRGAGGCSDARIVSVADGLGPALMRVLHDHVASLGVNVIAHSPVVGVQPGTDHVVLSVREPDGELRSLRARAVVAATGGVTYRVARERGETTTNPRNGNHILYDALGELGLERIHEDFFQYQPFGIVSFDAGAVGRCVPESIVNLPVRLLDRHGRVVCDLAADRLAVGDAIRATLGAGDGYRSAAGVEGVALTLSDVPVDDLRERFPRLAAVLARHDALGDDVLVRPFLHYQLGGFRATIDGCTAVPRLFVAGEMTGGLHGRNRLMGNGITDSLVRGRAAGRAAAALAVGHPVDCTEPPTSPE